MARKWTFNIEEVVVTLPPNIRFFVIISFPIVIRLTQFVILIHGLTYLISSQGDYEYQSFDITVISYPSIPTTIRHDEESIMQRQYFRDALCQQSLQLSFHINRFMIPRHKFHLTTKLFYQQSFLWLRQSWIERMVGIC